METDNRQPALYLLRKNPRQENFCISHRYLLSKGTINELTLWIIIHNSIFRREKLSIMYREQLVHQCWTIDWSRCHILYFAK